MDTSTTNYPPHSRACGVRELKTHLSTLLRQVQAGAEIIVTHRGEPVAKLVGIEAGDLSLSDRLERLENAGILEPMGARSRRDLPPPLPVSRSAQQILKEDREG